MVRAILREMLARYLAKRADALGKQWHAALMRDDHAQADVLHSLYIDARCDALTLAQRPYR
jgi:hypothetical protein